MDASEIASLGDRELLRLLQERDAHILNANTTELGHLFAYSFHAYNSLTREYRDASFGEQLYTDQYYFKSMAHPENRHLAKTPEGAGKAPDLLHMYLRTLGIRISNVIIPAAKRLIGDEAVIRKLGTYDPERKKHNALKDRPPNAEAKKILDGASQFDVELRDTSGKRYTIPLENERTLYHDRSFSVLETALALHAQTTQAAGRSSETFSWIRDAISLQSVETMVQVQEIIERGIQRQFPEKTLADFKLVVPLQNRLSFARAVFERAHETRRDHALDQIWTTDDSSNSRFKPTTLALASVGENAEGFTIRNPRDAAAVLFMMPRTFHILQYCFSQKGNPDVELSEGEQRAYATLATRVFGQPSNAYAAACVRSKIDLLRATFVKNAAVLAAVKNHPYIIPKFGISKAVSLILSMMREAMWLPHSLVTDSSNGEPTPSNQFSIE